MTAPTGCHACSDKGWVIYDGTPNEIDPCPQCRSEPDDEFHPPPHDPSVFKGRVRPAGLYRTPPSAIPPALVDAIRTLRDAWTEDWSLLPDAVEAVIEFVSDSRLNNNTYQQEQ